MRFKEPKHTDSSGQSRSRKTPYTEVGAGSFLASGAATGRRETKESDGDSSFHLEKGSRVTAEAAGK